MLKYNDSIGIAACSNGLAISNKDKIFSLETTLKTIGLNVVYTNKIYKEYSVFNGTPKEKADELMKMFLNEDIKAIFDISGGDLANTVLDYLDFDKIKENYKPFFGYSDLTVILNAIYAKTNKKSYLYQIRNLIYENKEKQIKDFKETLLDEKNDSLYDFDYKWINGEYMKGEVIGGNIRCFLKLAGTDYMPDFDGKILLLEGLSGDIPKMVTYLNQYKTLKAFEKINGIILGTFTEMERENYSPNIVELVKEITENKIPIIKTNEIGHGTDSKCIIIGKEAEFKL